jgi:prepilin-type N-terminal cleavage/methylation domain-containing protein
MSHPPRKEGLLSPHNRAAVAGFSLIEMLITVALILVIYVMMFSHGSRSHQQRQLAACRKNLQHIHLALTIYSADNQDAFPNLTGANTAEQPLSLLVPRATTLTAIFVCPGSKDKSLPEAEPFARRKISYAYYMGLNAKDAPGNPLISDQQVNTSPKKTGDLLFSADGKNPGGKHHKHGGNVLFQSGEVKKSPPTAAFDLPQPANSILLNPKL